MILKIRTWNRVTRYLAKRYDIVSLWLNVWDDRFEFEDYENYTSRQFLWGCFKAWIKKDVCWDCQGHGTIGYYEPEVCSTCAGFGFNWKNEPEPDWESMAEGMREYDRLHQEETTG